MRERSRPSQVGELLRCLNIDPAALPAGAMPGAERDAWDGIFHAGGPRLPEAAAAAEVAAGEGLGADGDAGRRWAEEFGGLSLDGVPPAAGAAWAGEFQRGAPGAPAGWADSFAAQQRGAFAGPGAGPQRGWAEQFAEEQRGAGWAEDFGRAEAAAVRLPLPLPYPYPDPNLPPPPPLQPRTPPRRLSLSLDSLLT